MNEFIKNTIALVAPHIPLHYLLRVNKLPLVLPFYHTVASGENKFINSYQVRALSEFERELDYLLKYFKPVSLEEIVNSPDKGKMHLSFDDGLKECATVIAPVLMRKGIPATFFVSPAFVDNKQLFHRFKRAILEDEEVLPLHGKRYYFHEAEQLDALAETKQIDFSVYKPYMNFHDIENLYHQGFTIGGHSVNHPEMWLLSEGEQLRQVVESMQWINSRFKQKIRAFSFPFTDDGLKLSLFEKIRHSGELDVSFGTAGLKFDVAPFHFQRIPLERSKKWTAEKVIHFEFLYFHLRKLLFANKVNR